MIPQPQVGDNMVIAPSKILIGVTGGIAVYKAVELVRLLKKQNLDVRVVMTEAALQFVQPLTFATLSENFVYTAMFKQTGQCEHIELAKWADAILIAPATANVIAKLAHGIADDLLTTICLACEKQIYVAPAMNKVMWGKAATQLNVKKLLRMGIRVLGPSQGEQACGDIGLGRMLEPQTIVDMFTNNMEKLLIDKNVVITAGPTIEPIDPIRFISNYRSGKMGYAIANAATKHGARVTLISGPTTLKLPDGCYKYIPITTAQEMHVAVMQHIANCDIFIAAAAVADYRVEKFHATKIKKTSNDSLTLHLVKNPDILHDVTKLDKRPFTVGFAAETEMLEENAIKKIRQKDSDMTIGNIVGKSQGFNRDENELLVLSKTGHKIQLTKKNKLALAYELIRIIATEFKEWKL